MLKLTTATAALCLVLSIPADARQRYSWGDESWSRQRVYYSHNWLMFDFGYREYRAPRKRVAKRHHPRRPASVIARKHRHVAPVAALPSGRHCRSGFAALNCVVPELAAKAREIVSACGSRVTSAVAHRPYRSNHPLGRAVDLAGNPVCIYSMLKGWRGGYSVDYHTAPGGKHVHISWNPGGQEWGVRFAHSHWGRSGRYASRKYRIHVARYR